MGQIIDKLGRFIPGIRDGKVEEALRIIQGDIPAIPRPFRDIASRTGLAETEVIALIRELKAGRVLRRFGAVLRHQRAGFTENAILAAAVSPDNLERTGSILASFREISHCYQREPMFLGRYGIFAMVHAGPGELQDLIEKITRQAGISSYIVLPSLKELKKTSMELI